MKRPPSVWIAQFLVGMAGALLVFGSFRWFQLILDGLDQGAQLNSFWLTVEAACRLVLLGLFASTFWSIARGKPAGRWLGVASLVTILALATWAHVLQREPPWRYENPAQEGGAFIIQALMVAAFVALIWRFGFSRASRAYFAG
jgi:hypothetical protein